jgi:hypothetical protein
MARWLVLLSALFLLAGSSAHSRPKLTVRSQTDVTTASNTDSDPASFVNVFVGTTNGGHVFPGLLIRHIFDFC